MAEFVCARILLGTYLPKLLGRLGGRVEFCMVVLFTLHWVVLVGRAGEGGSSVNFNRQVVPGLPGPILMIAPGGIGSRS